MAFRASHPRSVRNRSDYGDHLLPSRTFPQWLSATKFWMLLFGVNFALGVATGAILEFEFGTNWSNYSWFVGDIFGAPLAVEGIFAFSWNRLS